MNALIIKSYFDGATDLLHFSSTVHLITFQDKYILKFLHIIFIVGKD